MKRSTPRRAVGFRPSRVVSVLCALAASACAAGCGPDVKVKTAALADTSKLQTYGWLPGEGDVVGVYGTRAQLVTDTMRKSIDEGMQRKGFRPAAAEAEPDVQVLYQLGVRSRREVTKYQTVEHQGETFAVPAEVQVYRAGTIIVYLLDPRAHDVLWIGTASAEAKAADSNTTIRTRLERGVRAIFDGMKDRKPAATAGATANAR